MHIFAYITYIYIYICICVHRTVYTHICTSVYTHICTCMFSHVEYLMGLCSSIACHGFVYIYKYTYMYIYIYILLSTYTGIDIFPTLICGYIGCFCGVDEDFCGDEGLFSRHTQEWTFLPPSLNLCTRRFPRWEVIWGRRMVREGRAWGRGRGGRGHQ